MTRDPRNFIKRMRAWRGEMAFQGQSSTLLDVSLGSDYLSSLRSRLYIRPAHKVFEIFWTGLFILCSRAKKVLFLRFSPGETKQF
jgi:hypothetical protein